ncbi:hypothetical protein [Paenibacillus sp. YPG26]|uniref:hypothetical protein n=1 Tax=Paenibacillus sp. YPG26 TaxID=2878915 RepID=UPI00203A9BFE|nr:hypothetical protein [Paenibacillus sp. YPG26]USB34195.1 hypothetical protein LDO05_05130 [Paenibacillus sp. YPG26]
METTVCPWCLTEIVWDEEIGPEEECPHCHNELKGYRTLQINLGDEDPEEEDEQEPEESQDSLGFWDADEEESSGAVRRVNSFATAGADLLEYESAVERVLGMQDEVPECPHCREYMLLAGQEQVNANSGMQQQNTPLLKAPYTLNVYVCSSCFSVSRVLSEADKHQFIRNITNSKK